MSMYSDYKCGALDEIEYRNLRGRENREYRAGTEQEGIDNGERHDLQDRGCDNNSRLD